MRCPKCHSKNVKIQVVNDQQLANKHHGIIWWMLIGFWWIPIKWIFFTIPALFIKMLGSNKKKIVNRHVSVCVCQNCGYNWKA